MKLIDPYNEQADTWEWLRAKIMSANKYKDITQWR
jgi:hypothetical protein